VFHVKPFFSSARPSALHYKASYQSGGMASTLNVCSVAWPGAGKHPKVNPSLEKEGELRKVLRSERFHIANRKTILQLEVVRTNVDSTLDFHVNLMTDERRLQVAVFVEVVLVPRDVWPNTHMRTVHPRG